MIEIVLIVIAIAAGLRLAYLLDKFRVKCKHEECEEVFVVPGRCVEYRCKKCGKTIWEDL